MSWLGLKKSGDKTSAKARNQRVSTPIVLQMHATECGAACLGSVLRYFGRWVSLTELREKCEVSRDGSSAASILRAAKHYNLKCSGLSITAENLKLLDMPLILFWQFSHFVVLEGIDDKSFFLNDPAIGRRKVSSEEFGRSFSGIALRFERDEGFTPGGDPPSLWEQLNGLLHGSWQALLGLITCGIMLALLTLIMPISLSIFIDDVLTSYEPWSALFLVLVGGAALAYVLTLLKYKFLKRLAIRISVVGYDRGLSRMLRLPLEFFQYRLVSDLTGRISSIDRIAKNLTDQFLVLVIDMGISVVLLIAMFVFDPLLSLIVILVALVHGVLAHGFKALRVVRSQAMRREQGLLLGSGMQMLSHAESIRMTGSDDRFMSRLTGQQARELKARQLYAEIASANGALPDLIGMFRSALVMAIGAGLVIAGEMTLGTLVGFYILAEIFFTPISRFLEFADERQALDADFQQLDDVSEAEEDPIFKRRSSESESLQTFNGRLQLTGRLEFRDVSFGYNRSRPPLIENFNLEIMPGQRIAIVGPSGSGKSTIANLASGMYKPWSGEIRFDGHLRDEIPEEVLRRSISLVDQEVVLFSGSLRDNITLWSPSVPDEAIHVATRDASIHEDILVRPDGYESMVEEGGLNFSGGQRQRLEIARALVGSPTVLILDEATSALDAATEEKVDMALRRRGVTCLIVAHRLSTVRDCDEIIVLNKGGEVQRGSHDELIVDQAGMYYKLVKSG